MLGRALMRPGQRSWRNEIFTACTVPINATTSVAPRLLIVDGHSYAYRAFFAIRKLTSPAGKPTNAIYGFIRMLGKIHALVGPSHAVVVWDGGLAQERMKLLPEYKALRPRMPSEMEEQLDEIVAYLNAAQIASWVKDGIEADDCIAALTSRAVAAGMDVVIATSDKDFMQLVSPRVRLLGPSGNADAFVDASQVKAKTGVEPSQIIDWLSLVGDSVDNIPGVAGIGPKTATVLLQQFGSIEELYHHLSEVTPSRLRVQLEASVELLRRNRKLVQLDVAVPCELELEALRVRKADAGLLGRLYEGWGFKTLLRELEEQFQNTGDLFDEKAGQCNV